MKKYLVILFMLLTCAVNAQVVNTSVWFAPPASADTLGPELLTNGEFSEDATWDKGAGWTITGGYAVATDVARNVALSQYITQPEVGDEYYVELEIENYTSGSVEIGISSNYSYTDKRTGDGTHTVTITTSSTPNNSFIIRSGSVAAANFKINRVSCKKKLN